MVTQLIRRTACVAALCVATFFAGCSDDSVSPQDEKPKNGILEVVAPLGGESFKIGQSVTVRFKVNPKQVSSVALQVQIDTTAAAAWHYIPSIALTPTKTDSDGELISYTWTIGNEHVKPAYKDVNAMCRIKVSDYNNGSNLDRSGYFTISK